MGRERKAVLGFVSVLNEPGALDEMGIGRIRDTIADRAPTSLRNCGRLLEVISKLSARIAATAGCSFRYQD